MTKQFEFAIVIGRFEPVHRAHHELFKLAFDVGERVIIILGSHNKASNPKDPWSSEERKEMILSTLEPAERERVQFLPIRDSLYNFDTWLADVQYRVGQLTDYSKSIVLIGHKSDWTSYYLDSFPNWQFVNYKPQHPIHATKIRELYFSNDNSYQTYLNKNVVQYLEEFKKTPKFALLKDNFDDLAEYHKKWRGPFPPVFHTVDAIVIKSGHLLVVRRKGRYGKGLLALPGGFLKPTKTLLESVIEELKEETHIAVDKETLQNSIVNQRVFDSPFRSLRGRTLTSAYHFNLGVGPLPKVRGGDDAEHASWMQLAEFYTKEEQVFEDHYHMVLWFVSNKLVSGEETFNHTESVK